jgi:competence protein ComEA
MNMKRAQKIFILTLVLALLGAFSPSLWAQEAQKININVASVEELSQLNKVGPKYAERIVQYREANGPFKNVEEITNVQGIGEKTLEANKDRMTVD